MKQSSAESDLERLRRRAETAIRRARGRREVESLLRRILDLAPEGSEPAVFAHRHLAELLVEENSWQAALHLKCVLPHLDGDDVVHALIGLTQALLGNFRFAVAAYRRALAIAPQNPWYHHNLGHLLDVALGQPKEAVRHLKAAHRLSDARRPSEPPRDEITASLAHCLARTGDLQQAQKLAQQAVRGSPRNRDHKTLLAWIEDGAPEDPEAKAPRKERGRGGSSRSARSKSEARGKEVLRAIERGMREAGFSPGQVERARAMWSDYRDERAVRVVKPEVYAAAVEYAIAIVNGLDGVTKGAIARRYGVAPTSLSSRFGDIRDALSLQPGDPRYA